MKKLIALIGAAALGFAAFAEATVSPLLNTVENFEGFEVGTAITNATSYEVGESATVVYPWSLAADADEDSAKIAEEGEDGNKYVALETDASKPLCRAINNRESSIAELTPADIDTGLFMDVMVKFSLAEEVGTIAAGTKLCIWAQQIEADEGQGIAAATNIVVTAGQVNNETLAVTPTNFVLAVGDNFDFAAWHRVTVRAIKDVTDELRVVGFVVFIDGEKAAAIETGYAEMVGLSDTKMTSEAKKFYAEKQLFLSCVSPEDPSAQKLTYMGFAGSGAADDIAIYNRDGAKENLKFAVGDQTFTITIAGAITDFSWQANDGVSSGTMADIEDGAITVDGSATTITFSGLTVSDPAKYSVKGATEGTLVVDLTTLEGSTVDLAVDTIAFIVNDKPFTSFEAAFAEALTSGKPMILNAPFTMAEGQTIGGEAAQSIVLDLNGETLTFDQTTAEADGMFVITENGSFKLVDSVGGGKLTYNKSGEVLVVPALIYQTDGAVVIGDLANDAGALVDGYIDTYAANPEDPDGDFSAGSFIIYNGKFTELGFGEGFEYVDNISAQSEGAGESDLYVVTPKSAPVVKPFAIIIAGETETTTNYYDTLAEAVEAAQANDTITVLENATLTTSTYIEKALAINLNGKTLTFADGVVDGIVFQGADGVISNGTFASTLSTLQNGLCIDFNSANGLLKDLTISTHNFKWGIGGDLAGDTDWQTANPPTFTVTCENVDVSGERSVVQAEGVNLTLDADCSVTQTGTGESEEWRYCAIHAGFNAVVTIAGGQYSAAQFVICKMSSPAKIYVTDGEFTGTLKTYEISPEERKQYGSDVWAIAGGTYTVDPTPYLADGYTAILDTETGKYSVTESKGFIIRIAGINAAAVTEDDTSFTVATTDKPLVYIAGVAAEVTGTAGAWTVAKPAITADTCVSFVKDQAITAPQQKWYESPKRVGIMWYDQETHKGYGSDDYTGYASSFDGLYVGLAYGSSNTKSYLGNVANIIDGDTTNIYAYQDNNRGNCVSKEWGVMLVGTAGSENKLRAWNLNENSKIATVTLKADGYDSFSGDSIAIIGNKLWVNGYAGANNKAIYRFTIPTSGFVDGLELTAEAVVTADEQIRNFRVYEVGGKFIVYAKTDAAFYVGTMEDGLVKKDDFNTNGNGRYCDVAVAGSHLYIFNAYTADVEMYDIDTTTGWFAPEAVPTKISMLEVCGQPSWTSSNAGRGSSIFVTPDETTLVHCGYFGASAVQYCPQYEVKFVVDGVEIATNKVWEGDTTTAPADPTKEGFKFLGWFAPDAETAFDFTTQITADLTLTAKLEADIQPLDPEEPKISDNPVEEAAKMNENGSLKPEFIKVPTGAVAADYAALFVAVPGDGVVTIELNEDGTNTLQQSANNLAEAVAGLGDSTADSVTVTVTDAMIAAEAIVPGFYYGLGASTTVDGAKVVGEGQWKQATTEGIEGGLTAAKPDTSKGFFQIKVSVKNPVK